MKDQKKEYNLSSCASSADKLLQYLKQKASNHNCYKCYSRIDDIVSIRDNKFLYLGTGAKWNDKTDRNGFNSDQFKNINFGKCFSFSQDESVAMWMLYGGIEKQGGMIDFTKKGLKSILSAQSIEFGYSVNRKFVLEKELQRDSFDLFCIDVVYYKENSRGYFIKRSDESINCLSRDVFDQLKLCKKVYPWQYENECRLVCSVNKAILSKTCNVARINLSKLDVGKSFERIYHSPNYPSVNTKNTLPSKLDGSIDWSLCDNQLCERLFVKEET